MADRRDSILGGIPNGGILIDAAPTREYEILTFADGDHTVYALRAWVGGRDGGLMTDKADAPLTFVSKAMIRAFLSSVGWSERPPAVALAVGGDD